MRHAFSPPLPLPLASPKPALAFAVLCATPRRRLVAPRRLPSPLHPGPLAALRTAVHVPAVALAADHHQPATAPTAELPSFMGFGCWVCRVDEPPGRIETKFDLRSALCETRDLSTPLRDVDGYSRSATSSRTAAPASFFLMAAWNLRRSLLVPKKRGGVVRVHAATSLAHGITRIPVIADNSWGVVCLPGEPVGEGGEVRGEKHIGLRDTVRDGPAHVDANRFGVFAALGRAGACSPESEDPQHRHQPERSDDERHSRRREWHPQFSEKEPHVG